MDSSSVASPHLPSYQVEELEDCEAALGAAIGTIEEKDKHELLESVRLRLSNLIGRIAKSQNQAQARRFA